MINEEDSSEAPYQAYQVFDLPIDALGIDVSKRLRGAPSSEAVFGMARALGVMGQLQNVIVAWRGEAYELVAGYKRALAIREYGRMIGLETISVLSVKPEDADLAALIEGHAREPSSTFELASYLAGFAASGTSVPYLALYSAKSEEYVRSLLRLYRELPTNIRAAWAADRDHRFTFVRLNDLVRLKQAGDEVGLEARFQEILGKAKKRGGTGSTSGFKTADQCLDESLKACGLTKQQNGLVTPSARSSRDDRNDRRRARRISRAQLEKMEARLGSIAPDQLTRFRVGGETFHRFICAVLGKAPRSEAWSIVDRFAFDAERDLETAIANEDMEAADVEYAQQPDHADDSWPDVTEDAVDVHRLDDPTFRANADDAHRANWVPGAVEYPEQPDFAVSPNDELEGELLEGKEESLASDFSSPFEEDAGIFPAPNAHAERDRARKLSRPPTQNTPARSRAARFGQSDLPGSGSRTARSTAALKTTRASSRQPP